MSTFKLHVHKFTFTQWYDCFSHQKRMNSHTSPIHVCIHIAWLNLALVQRIELDLPKVGTNQSPVTISSIFSPCNIIELHSYTYVYTLYSKIYEYKLNKWALSFMAYISMLTHALAHNVCNIVYIYQYYMLIHIHPAHPIPSRTFQY